MKNWQEMIGKWVRKTFGDESMNTRERNLRFLEEAVELVQSHNITHEEASRIVARVYIKPVGNPVQEMGGVMVTLLALAECQRYDTHECLMREWDRIRNPDDQLKAKLKASQESKLEAGL